MKAILKTSVVMIGTIIGAGFASGQEIYLFFGKFGHVGIVSMILSCLIAGIILQKTMCFAKRENITSYSEFLETLFQNHKQNKILVESIHLIITLFLGISFIIMVAGFGTYFQQELGMPHLIGCLLICGLSLLVMRNSTNGIVKVNTVGIPILIFFILVLGLLYRHQTMAQDATESQPFQSALHGILYASYNSIVLIPILIDLQAFLKSKREITIVSLICSGILILLGCTILHLLQAIEGAGQMEIPLLYVAKAAGKGFGYCYGIAILVAIFTSAVSARIWIFTKYFEEYQTTNKKFFNIMPSCHSSRQYWLF